jgi:hypothetical protein
LRASNHWRTRLSGELLTSSESTQVSSKYLTGRHLEWLLETAQAPTVHHVGH